MIKIKAHVLVQLYKMQSRNVNLEREDQLKIAETNLTVMMEFVHLGFTDTPNFSGFFLGYS